MWAARTAVARPSGGMDNQVARRENSTPQSWIVAVWDCDSEGLWAVVAAGGGTLTGQVGTMRVRGRIQVVVGDAVVVRVKGKDGREILNEDSTLNLDGQRSMGDCGLDSLVSEELEHPDIVDHTREEVTVVTGDESVPTVLKGDSRHLR